jgi:hypothetical protein
MSGMTERGSRRRSFGRAVAESCSPARNSRWMLASLGIGAGLGLVAGLQRLGRESARISPEVALTAIRAAVAFLVSAWLVVVAIRFGRLRRGTPNGQQPSKRSM